MTDLYKATNRKKVAFSVLVVAVSFTIAPWFPRLVVGCSHWNRVRNRVREQANEDKRQCIAENIVT